MSFRDRLPSRRVALLAASTAVLLIIAYPPLSLTLPTFFVLVPMLWALDELRRRGGTPGQAAWLGWWFGVFAHGVALYWMVIALWHFTKLSALGYAASVLLVLSPQWAFMAWVIYRAWTRTRMPRLVIFPGAWTAVEWIQGHYGDLRFPWLGLGSALPRVTTLVQWADLAGARGVTLWLAVCNVLVFLALRQRTWKPLVPLAASVLLAFGYGTWRERTTEMRPVATVGLLQPNVGWQERRSERENISLLNELLQMSRRAGADSSVRLIAWPEAAVPTFFVDHPNYTDSLMALARELGRPILAGGLDAQFYPDRSYDYYNAAFLFAGNGELTQPVYRKKYLVPIVERVPFINPRWFKSLKWFGGFGKGDRFPVYRLDAGGFGVLICFESAFEDLSRRYRRDGADFLVNITNDGWYGDTWAPAQHASHLVMRAIETRTGIARAANTGITELVDPLGRVHQATRLNVDTIVTGTVMTTAVRTPYVRFGDWVAVLVLIGLAALTIAGFTAKPPPQETA